MTRNSIRIEISDDEETICLIPDPSISIEFMMELTKLAGNLGYVWWLPADERRGFLYSKNKTTPETSEASALTSEESENRLEIPSFCQPSP